MKHYLKANQDVYQIRPDDVRFQKMGTVHGSFEEYTDQIREFYKEYQPKFFDFLVRQIWLEQQFTYDGVRRNKRMRNGYTPDQAWGLFMSCVVGTSQKFSLNFTFTAVSTYLKTFFPEFLIKNPFEEPEYYKYPYKNISLDHLSFVYMMPNRMELLKDADEKAKKFDVFCNESYNWAQEYNWEMTDDERARVKKAKLKKNIAMKSNDDTDRFELTSNGYFWKHLRDNLLPRDWSDYTFKFDTKK